MAIFKRGRVYWYHFTFNGQHVQESTKQGNHHVARQMEAAHRTALAKGEGGIRERKQAPTLRDFAPTFLDNAGLGRKQESSYKPGTGRLSESIVSHQHIELRKKLKLPAGLVLHSLRHTFLRRGLALVGPMRSQSSGLPATLRARSPRNTSPDA